MRCVALKKNRFTTFTLVFYILFSLILIIYYIVYNETPLLKRQVWIKTVHRSAPFRATFRWRVSVILMKCPPVARAFKMSILLYLGTRRVHCQTAAASSVYTTILTVAVPAFGDTIICVYPCVRAYTYRKCAACLCVCLRCRASRRQKLRFQQ